MALPPEPCRNPHAIYGTPQMTRILIIDDEADLLALMAEYLTEEGYDVLTARNGREGLNSVAAFRPEIVVTDIYMPEVDGIEVILTLINRHPKIKIIATSRGGSVCRYPFLDEAQLFGALAVIEKPFSLAAFLSLVNDVAARESASASVSRSVAG